jgi:serine/threonine-protein kinase
VQYAHRNLIVHRDIKPDNILVGEDGRPILLDFGIAKLLRPELLGIKANETRAGSHLMTPEFASPEQFRGDRVSTASDVYSLGVLLYVLVCGNLPHSPEDLELADFARRVCEQDPLPPSLRIADPDARPSADIDAIVMKALRKEAESRYLSVEELAADLHRYLRGFPVRAREGNWRYIAAKFLRRHRLAVAFSAVMAVVLAASGIALYSFSRSAARQRDIANGSVEFVMDLLEGGDPNSRGDRVIAARALLDEASSRLLENKFRADPEVRFVLASKIGDIYRQLGAYERSEPLFQLALQVAKETGGERSRDAANVLVRLADLHREMGKVEVAEAEARRALEVNRQLFGNRSQQTADALNITGILLQIRGKHDEAEAVFREAVEVRRKVLSPTDPFLALSLGNLGNILRDKGDSAGARQCFEEALQIRRKAFGNEHPRVASSLGQLSQIAVAEKRFDEAVTLAEQCVRISRKAYQGDNPDLARALLHYGNALLEVKRFEESETALVEALQIQQKARGPEAVETSFVESALASNYAASGRLAEAETLRAHVFEIREKKLGRLHPRTVDARLLLVDLLIERGKPATARRFLDELAALDLDAGTKQKLDRALGRLHATR